jgi:acetyl esterase/lipase
MNKEIEAAVAPGLSSEPAKLVVTVLFTTAESTRTALKLAARLAKGFDTSIEVVAPQVVPFPDPLDHPSIDTGFLLRRLCEVVAGVPVQTAVHLILGRDLEQILLSALRPNSIVLIGEHEPLWPGRRRRLAESLRARGHQVIFAGHRSGKHA